MRAGDGLPEKATSQRNTKGPMPGRNSAASRQRRRPSRVSNLLAGISAIITPSAVTPASRAAGGITPAPSYYRTRALHMSQGS